MKKKSYVRCLYLCLPELLSSPLFFFNFLERYNEKDEEENIINLTSDRREQVHFLAFLFSTKCPVSLLNFSLKKNENK
jgi:hypothetical protein